MDRAIYTSMSAASAILVQHSVTANNLANVSTTGFRAQIATFLAAPVNGPTFLTRTLVVPSVPSNNFSPGAVNVSGSNLDIAIDQDGWLAVQLPDGHEAYTRNGHIEIDSMGKLKIQKYPLLGINNQPITVPLGSTINFDRDGTVSIVGDDNNPNNITRIGQLKLIRIEPNSLRHEDNGLFNLTDVARSKRGNKLSSDSKLRLTQGALEASNVSAVQTMVKLLSSARSFEMNMKIIGYINDNARISNQLLAIS